MHLYHHHRPLHKLGGAVDTSIDDENGMGLSLSLVE